MAITRIEMQQVFESVEYANSHPDRYLAGTTNWCAAVAFALNRLIINAAPMSTDSVQRKRVFWGEEWVHVVRATDYDALAAQRDEGLAREARLRDELALCVEQKDALSELVDQVLGLLRADKASHAQYTIIRHQGFPDDRTAFLDIASPRCADGEKGE